MEGDNQNGQKEEQKEKHSTESDKEQTEQQHKPVEQHKHAEHHYMDAKKIKTIFTILFLLVLLTAGIVRIKYAFVESVWVDETVYMWQGYRLLHEPSLMLTSDYYGNTPFPLLFIAFFNLFTSDRLIAGRLSTYFFALLGIALAYLIGKELKDEHTGLLAALLLIFNPLHWFIGSRTLMDLPEATMISLTVYLLLRFEKDRNLYNGLFLFLAIIATAFTKLPGLLIVPGVIFYYMLTFLIEPKKIKERILLLKEKNNAIIASIISIIVITLILSKYTFIKGLIIAMQPRLDFVNQLPFMFTITLLIFAGFGIAFSILYKNKNSLALICAIASFLLAFSLFPAEPDPRHIAPIIPFGIIIASYGFFELGAIIKQFINVPYAEWILLVIGGLFVIQLYPQGIALNVDKSYSFTGYNEAGEWFAQNLPTGTLAYVSSQGPMRLFSGLGYITEGGPIRQIQTFGDGEIPDFSKATFPIYLHIDMWERGPKWSYPLTQEKLGYLQSLGFQVVKVVERQFPTQQGMQKIPVHLILKGEKQKKFI